MFKENEWGNLLRKEIHGRWLFYLSLLFIHSFISRFHLVTGGDGGLLLYTSGMGFYRFPLLEADLYTMHHSYLTTIIFLFRR